MKRVVSASVILGLILAGVACSAKQKKSVELTSPEQKYSYMIGQDIGNSLKGLQTEINMDALVSGIEDILQSRKSQLTPEELETLKMEFSKKMQGEQESRQASAGEKNLKEAEKFLLENKSKEGVVTTASGLQYMIIKKSTGPKPAATDKVSVHYKGTLLDGTEFDSSYKRGSPASFPVNAVIPGWTEALQLMEVGSHYKLFIPPSIGYGERGAGGAIGPNAMLIFEVELIAIEK